MDDFLDSHPLLTNLKEVECQSIGRKFHFLHSLSLPTVKSDASDSLSCANSFWKLPDMRFQPTRFIDNWTYDRRFNSRYSFGFVDGLLEVIWTRDRMLAAKNMNANAQNISGTRLILKTNPI